MRKSTQMILEYFPALKEHIHEHDSAVLKENVLSNLGKHEQVFLCLLWFFDNPDKESFNLESIYKNLDGDWLSLALECIFIFFTEDTYLIQDPNFSLVTENTEFLNQSEFVNFLVENKKLHGRNFSRPMLNTYLKRGDIPPPDLVVGKSKFWNKKTCEEYLHSIRI